jgi:hypothetical protein
MGKPSQPNNSFNRSADTQLVININRPVRPLIRALDGFIWNFLPQNASRRC